MFTQLAFSTAVLGTAFTIYAIEGAHWITAISVATGGYIIVATGGRLQRVVWNLKRQVNFFSKFSW